MCLILPPAWADTAALTESAYSVVGYVNGAVGFSFVPSVNLSVTSVSYLDYGMPGNSNPIVSFWAGSNTVLTSYTLPPGSGSGLTISSNVSFSLTAGQPYSITLQDGALNSSTGVLEDGGTNGEFQVASQLMDYNFLVVDTNGVFGSYGPNAALFGPNFTFVVVPEPASFLLTIFAGACLLAARAKPKKRQA
jgi:hypothetical protein